MIDKAEFKRLFDLHSAIVMLIDVNDNGKIIYTNIAAQKYYGYSESEFLELRALNFNTFSEEKIKEEMHNALQRVRNNFQFVHRLANGELKNVEVFSCPIQYDSRKVLLSIVTDITEKTLLQNKLIESEYRLSTALENVGDGVWDWDLETNKVLFSKKWKEMLGYSGNEIADDLEEWSKRVHPEDIASAVKSINDHIEGKTDFYRSEHRLLCKDGNYKWILDRGKIVEYRDKKPVRMIGTHTDLTEMKNIEKKLMEINSHKDMLLSIVSHDLRSPIGGFKNLIDYIIENFQSYHPDQVYRSLIDIQNSSSSIYDLLDNLLNWARLNMSAYLIHCEDIDIRKMIGRIVENLALVLKNKNISITNNVAEDVRIHSDADAVRIIFRNIIFNAMKYSHSGGNIDVFSEKAGDAVVIGIRDNGIGMTKDVLEKVKGNSLRMSNLGTNQEKGSGLGLNLCREMLKIIRGEIAFESEAGKGTLVRVVFNNGH